MLVTYLGDDPNKAANVVINFIGDHARFKVLEELFKDHMQMEIDAKGDDMLVGYHR